jgi:hypothetical protein
MAGRDGGRGQQFAEVPPGFRWLDPAVEADPIEVLQAEGVEFDEHHRANPNQRMTTVDLAQLLAVDIDEPNLRDPKEGVDRAQRFFTQLGESQPTDVAQGVRRVLDRWIEIGGTLDFGYGEETSCFLISTNGHGSRSAIWPLTTYPSGRCEVVFQHLARRAPFDDPALREELRQRLNGITGIDLPGVKIELRPSFPLDVLATPDAQDALADQLAWFRATVAA